ncbi:hypothetical protein B9Z55_003433 [Caenorhabditis nigoni]|uniref:C2H2-type domain-containing protein n=1 Tax=Caenorhabditis nigoni TaxID=1611254 RepID=A0A2G5VQB3_9PELO|nr:hypothetical protein B9Z55_003433 [Caenorhabditis nigoni]
MTVGILENQENCIPTTSKDSEAEKLGIPEIVKSEKSENPEDPGPSKIENSENPEDVESESAGPSKPEKSKFFAKNDFLLALAENHKNLRIEQKPVIEIDDDKPYIEWKRLECPICEFQIENTRFLAAHLVNEHGTEQEKEYFSMDGLIPKKFEILFDFAVRKQKEGSFVKRKIQKSTKRAKDTVLSCALSNPLAPFLMIRSLAVYSNGINEEIEGFKIDIQNASSELTSPVIFSWYFVDQTIQNIQERREKRQNEKKINFLQKEAGKWIERNDLLTKRVRSAEEQKLLAQALKMPLKFTRENVDQKLKEYKKMREEEEKREKEEEKINAKSSGLNEDGTKMSNVVKALHSTLVPSGALSRKRAAADKATEAMAQKTKKNR